MGRTGLGIVTKLFFGSGIAALAGCVSMAIFAAPAGAAPITDHSASGNPVVFCSTRIRQATQQNFPLYGPIDLVNQGCISGSKGYDKLVAPDGSWTSNPSGGDGVYSNSGGGDSEDAVEQSIVYATGKIVELTELGKDDRGNNEDKGSISVSSNIIPGGGKILFDYSNDGTSFSWLVENNAFQVAYITIKAANSYLLYEIPTGVFGGTFSSANLRSSSGNLNPQISHIKFWFTEYTSVPEPAALGLFGLGSAGLLLARRRRR